MCYRLVVIPTTTKLCMRAMPTITISIHELQICKQQQIASGTKSCKSICISYNMPKRYVAGLWTRDPRARSARGGSVHKPQHTD